MASEDKDKGVSQAYKDKFVAVLTLMMAGSYLIACLVGLYLGKIDFKDFAAALAPWVSLLLGYWLRGLNPPG